MDKINIYRLKQLFVEDELSEEEKKYIEFLENKIENSNTEKEVDFFNHHIKYIIETADLRGKNKTLENENRKLRDNLKQRTS